MADSKYGRLFTEQDVQRLVSATMGIIGLALREGEEPPLTGKAMLERALAVTEPAHLTFPADEPLFLLRGQDEEAVVPVGAYLQRLARRDGVGMAHIHAVNVALTKLRRWQAANPDRVKVPD